MYKIIGSDQLEYGPVTLDVLRQWIGDGRINAQTKVQAEGASDWKPAREIPELADALTRARTPQGRATPPPITGEVAPGKTSHTAVWSLALGTLGVMTCGALALITGPIGVALGIIGLSKIQKSNGALRGRGLALGGTIVSGVSLLFLPVLAGMLLPALAKAKVKAQSIACMNNLKQLCLAARMYSSDNKDRFPEASTWCDALVPYSGGQRPFKCPAGHSGGRCDYAFNANLGGVKATSFSPNTVLLFEADGGWNNAGDESAMLQQPRHGRMIGVGFADGHVELVAESRMGQLRWNP